MSKLPGGTQGDLSPCRARGGREKAFCSHVHFILGVTTVHKLAETKDMATPFSLEDLDEAAPALFYLKNAALADVPSETFVVGGVELPVHIAVVGTRSPVLLDAYMTQKEGEGSQEGEQPHKRARLEGVFDGFSIKDVALFLRFLYHPDDATPDNLAAVRPHLPALMRLAHKFDVPGLLAAVEEQLLPPLALHVRRGHSTSQLLEAAQLAETLHRPDLLARSVHGLASQLLRGMTTDVDRFVDVPDGNPVDAALLLATSRLAPVLSSGPLALLAGTLTGAALRLNQGMRGLDGILAPPVALSAWAQLRGVRGEYTWEAEGVPEVGETLLSPTFNVGGAVWRLELGCILGDHTEMLSAGLQLADVETRPVGAQVFAAGRVIVVNHGDTFQSLCCTLSAHSFDRNMPAKVMHTEADNLRIEDCEYLRDGKLTVRMEVYM